MLTYHRTSLLKSQAQTVVNTVNTVGVMGKGIASAFKSRYPAMFKQYRKLCQEHKFHVGQLWLWKAPDQWVLNFPTKKHWRNPSKLSYIEAGLRKLVDQYELRGIREIAFPRLGCGHGGLDWNDVRPMMEEFLRPLPIPVYIHDFEVDIGLPEHHSVSTDQQFERSYDSFLKHLDMIMEQGGGRFATFKNHSVYQASLDLNRNLLIQRPGKRAVIPNEELYELWTLLLRGPVTQRKLPGAARDSAYYVMPILAALPYVRPIKVGSSEGDDLAAVELMDLDAAVEILSSQESAGQGKLEWA